MTEEGRVLSKMVGGGQLASDGELTPVSGSMANWEQGTAGGYTLLASLEYIDLSGYSLQDKTIFFQGVINQQVGTVQGFMVAGGGVCQVLNLVTTTPVSIDDLNALQSDGFGWLLPGASESSFDLDNVIQGTIRQFEQLSTTSFLSLTSTSSWGSGSATAAQKLYITTALIYPTAVAGNIFLPDQAYVIPVLIDTEEELEYLMRLSRSLQPVY